ncbi:MAG TPA: helicase-associated domain-containing protein [Ktedonobacteraceae bacterium]|nr:helicase-associated domain-containing protein [Ktedonobacteraceae bacterium]
MEQSDLDLLRTVPTYHLQSMIKARRVPVSLRIQAGEQISSASLSSDSSSANMLEIAQHLLDSSSLAATLPGLDELDAAILRELVSCGGRANSRDLALYFTNAGLLTTEKPAPGLPEVPRLQPGLSVQYPVPQPHGAFELALRRLLGLGLIFWGKQTNFVGRDYANGIHDGVLIVPLAVREAVATQWGPEEDQLAGQDLEEVGELARSLQRTLYLYWSLVAALREGISLVNNGLLSRSSLRHVMEHIHIQTHGEQIRVESDAPHLLFIRLLLMKLGLLQERHNALYAAPAEAYFALPLIERTRRCYRLYLETPLWNDLLYLPEVNVRPGPGHLDPAHEEVIRARQALIERLVHQRIDEWHNISALIARTKLYIPYLLFPRQYGPRAERYSSGSNPYGWDFRLRRGWLTHREGWHLVEGGFIRTVVTGPLHWLGVIELENKESPTTFRLSAGAVAIMSNAEPRQEPEAWGRLIVQPNFELIALAPVSELLLVQLDRFAERTSLEHIAQYRLTKASVTRAIQKGLHVDAIQQTLEQAVGGDIPQNVRYSLVEWERQARRVEVWQGATLLEVDNAVLLDELFASDATRHLLGRRLSPLLAEVVPHQLAAVQQILWQRHYLPALSTAPTQDTAVENGRLVTHEPQWRLHDDGLLQPLYAVLDLYLAAEVKHFSDCEENTGWYQLTPASLLRAREEGIPLDYILRFLQQYCAGGIPGSLLIRLKLWGGGYGERQQIAIERSPMLRLPAQVLQDLQSDEELKLLLGTEVEHESRLVRVDPENLAQVEKLLNERGFAVE